MSQATSNGTDPLRDQGCDPLNAVEALTLSCSGSRHFVNENGTSESSSAGDRSLRTGYRDIVADDEQMCGNIGVGDRALFLGETKVKDITSADGGQGSVIQTHRVLEFVRRRWTHYLMMMIKTPFPLLAS